MTAPIVRWVNADTGEIKERPSAGIDRGVTASGEPYADEWQATDLELALGLVPDLLDAISTALMKGQSLEVGVVARRDESPPTSKWQLAKLQGLAQALCDELDGEVGLSPGVGACVASVREALAKEVRP